jgi:DNA/RNA-binding domain of Phe-tRNA-synthetase-like protein
VGIDDIWVDKAVWDLRPDFAVLLLAVYGMRNAPTDERSRGWLAEAAEHAAGDGPGNEHAGERVEAWREAYRAFGAKPQRTRPSVDALLRRLPLPEVNQIVDAYNAVSVRHALPIGGEDLTHYEGPARLVRATGDEPFDTVDAGEPVIDHPEPGEVVWRDDRGVTCRRWNWRQCVRTRITEETSDGLFILERLEPMELPELELAGKDLAQLIGTISPGARVESRLVTRG